MKLDSIGRFENKNIKVCHYKEAYIERVIPIDHVEIAYLKFSDRYSIFISKDDTVLVNAEFVYEYSGDGVHRYRGTDIIRPKNPGYKTVMHAFCRTQLSSYLENNGAESKKSIEIGPAIEHVGHLLREHDILVGIIYVKEGQNIAAQPPVAFTVTPIKNK